MISLPVVPMEYNKEGQKIVLNDLFPFFALRKNKSPFKRINHQYMHNIDFIYSNMSVSLHINDCLQPNH